MTDVPLPRLIHRAVLSGILGWFALKISLGDGDFRQTWHLFLIAVGLSFGWTFAWSIGLTAWRAILFWRKKRAAAQTRRAG